MHDVTRSDGPAAVSFIGIATGALAIGAIAVGAIAIGSMAIGALAIKKVKLRNVQIDSLTVRRLRVLEPSPAETPQSDQPSVATSDAAPDMVREVRPRSGPRRRRPRKPIELP